MNRPTADPPRVRLRDITPADADMLDAWNADAATGGKFNDFGIPGEPVDRAVLARGPLRNERNGILIVERLSDLEALGSVGWHKVRYGPNPESDAWNIGIELLPEARGHGYGVEAQAQLGTYRSSGPASIGSRRRPISRTSRNSAPWTRPAFGAKGSPAEPNSVRDGITTW